MMKDEKELSPEEQAAAVANAGIPKNFRQQVDMEAFYRFVHENDLREEALEIFDALRAKKNLARATKKSK